MKNYLKFLFILSLVFSFSFLFAQEETGGDEKFQQLLEHVEPVPELPDSVTVRYMAALAANHITGETPLV